MAFYLSIRDANTRGRVNRTLHVSRSCLSIKIFRGTVLHSSCLPRLSSQESLRGFHSLRASLIYIPPTRRPRHHGITLTCQSRLPLRHFPPLLLRQSVLPPSSSTSCTCEVRFLLRVHPSPAILSSSPLSHVRPIFLPSRVSRHFNITHQWFTITVTY